MRFKIDKVDGEMNGKSTFSLKDFKGQGINVFRSALIGTFMGVLPGVGGSAASILAYAQAKNFSKHPELLEHQCCQKVSSGSFQDLNNGLTGGAR